MSKAAASRHIEVFYALATGSPIELWCDCPIGHQHSYRQWVDQFQHTDRFRTGQRREDAMTIPAGPREGKKERRGE